LTDHTDTAGQHARSEAYGRAMRRLRSMGHAELHDSERDALRAACDALIFADADADEALERARRACTDMVDSSRVGEQRAAALLADIEACGPRPALAAW
jgi:hypothetical protein